MTFAFQGRRPQMFVTAASQLKENCFGLDVFIIMIHNDYMHCTLTLLPKECVEFEVSSVVV